VSPALATKAVDSSAHQASAPVRGLELLRAPFPPNQISKLPKPKSKDAPKGRCSECGGFHGLPAVHLDYVGHAALTDRLLDADPAWTWEPIADPASLGLLTSPGGMWIRLTVCGVSRLGFGHPDGKTGGDAVKEVIGDALRNAAMRFGAALDLWHKGDLHAARNGEASEPVAQTSAALSPPMPDGFDVWLADLEAVAESGTKLLQAMWKDSRADFRRHLTTENPTLWESLKTKAAAVVETEP
jgi:hypothetical protein